MGVHPALACAIRISIFVMTCALAGTAHAATRTMIEDVEPDASAATLRIKLTILNPTDAAVDHPVTDELLVVVTSNRVRTPMYARRDAATPTMITIGPKGFAEVVYRLDISPDLAAGAVNALLSLGGTNTEILFAMPPRSRGVSAASMASPPAIAAPAQAVLPPAEPGLASDEDRPFFANVSAYKPIYVVYGPSRFNDTLLQLSVKYQLFGTRGSGERRWKDGFHLGFTQRMFMDIGKVSSPFHDIEYQPELFYLFHPKAIGSGVSLGGQLGYRHQSNGKDGDDSRAYNILYARPEFAFDLGDQQATLAPMAWFYIGNHKSMSDVEDYRGYTGLSASFGSRDGLMLTTDGRFSFKGKGAVEGTLSYPVNRIFDTRLNLYLFAQGFTGYAENLIDYTRRSSHLRFGIGMVR